MCTTREQAASPGTAAEALACARAGLAFLAAADPAGMTGAERAELLRGLCQAESQHLAARSAVLAGFDAADDHVADGQATSRAWLRWQARATGAAAGAAVAWMRRLQAHPRVQAALAAGQVSPSWARHNRLDRPAARGCPRRRGPDPAAGRRRRGGAGGPGGAGRADPGPHRQSGR